MIYKKKKDTVGVYKGLVSMVAVYKGVRLVWGKFDRASCYSLGYWVDEYPWDDNLYWRD